MSANPPAGVHTHEGPSLVFAAGDGSPQAFVLPANSASASVGRGQSADLRLDWDDQVSRLHARLERVGAEWDLVDDGLSRNGTFVNDERLSGRRRLRHGDALRFGSTRATFRSPAADEAESPPSPPAVILSTTQRRVLSALCRPCRGRSGSERPATDQEIADELVLSVSEVTTHLRVLCAKLGIEGSAGDAWRRQLVDRAFSAGLIPERDT